MTQATNPIVVTDKGPRLARLVATCTGAPLAVVGLWALVPQAAEAGHDGNPAEFRDFEVPPPANRQRPATGMSPPQGKGTAA